MSAGPLMPLGRAGDRGASTPAEAARLAKATRDFQALFLMELMKPMTEQLSGSPLFGEEGTSRNGLYSWFWGEALADHLAGAWPLPSISGAGASATDAGQTRTAATKGKAAPIPLAQAAGPIPLEQAAQAIEPESDAGQTTPGVLETLIARAGRLFRLPANLVRAVVQVESGGKRDAVSSKGAVGLMQLMPETAREMGARDPLDPWENLCAGVKYLSRQLNRFGSVEQALAAYNAGPSAVAAHGGVPPYPETRAYVERVLSAKARLDADRPLDA